MLLFVIGVNVNESLRWLMLALSSMYVLISACAPFLVDSNVL